MQNNRIKIAAILLISCLGIQICNAQIFEVTIDKSIDYKAPSKKYKSARIQAEASLTLPFWDDFSWSKLVPDTTLWQKDSIGMVEISPSNGINPPTFNVATFDGLRLNGTPYSTNFGDFESGDTDILTSNPIDLSSGPNGIAIEERSSVWLSFFFQKQGNGEQPDDQDGLRVEFLSITPTDTTWEVQSEIIIKGAEVTDTDFHQIIHQVSGEEYFHNIFQFRIIATGRQTGAYDTWNVDYVYLNKGRDANDLQYLDRSFNAPISSPFKGFTSLPINHFLPIQDELSIPLESHFIALGETQVFNFDLEANISYLVDNVTFNYFDQLDNGNALISNQPNIDVVSDSVVDFSKIDADASEAKISLKLYGDLQEDDILNKPYNSQINDTIYGEYFLKDYYAYDDGTAEKGAGVNREGDQIVVKFPFLGQETSFFKGVDMYIPQVVGIAQHGERIKINIWSHGPNGPAALLASRYLTIPKIETLNKFYRVEFSNPVIVTDTFYVGWEQISSQQIFVGLDKNINSQDKIWLHTTTEWEPNNNQIEGSLMIRPYFEENAQITATDNFDNLNTVIYPNPSTRYFTVKSQDLNNITVVNLAGQQIHPTIQKEKNITLLDFVSYPSGVYIIKYNHQNAQYFKRLILSK